MVVEYTFDELRKLITEEELDNLAKSLNKFLEVYFKYIYLNEVHLSNICPIFNKDVVLKLLILIFFKDEHP